MTAAQNKVVLSYHITRGLYFQAVIFAATVVTLYPRAKTFLKSPPIDPFLNVKSIFECNAF